MNTTPGFLNYAPIDEKPTGYTCQKVDDKSWFFFWDASVWQINMLDPNPLTYVCEDGTYIRTIQKNFQSDFGSIPPPCRSLPSMSETRFLLSYLFHDCAYQTHQALFSADGINWLPKELDRATVDNILKEMIMHEPDPGNVVSANIVWSQVRMWGWSAWGANSAYGMKHMVKRQQLSMALRRPT